MEKLKINAIMQKHSYSFYGNWRSEMMRNEQDKFITKMLTYYDDDYTKFVIVSNQRYYGLVE